MSGRVFVGSSNERKTAATDLVALLRERLGKTVTIELWPDAFLLSKTNIESIEQAALNADFAVLLVTADDALRIRRKQAFAPRDNITFEIGFFMGHLGRERCYVVQQKVPRLRVASDLLGVTVASFAVARRTDVRAALAPVSDQLATAIRAQGPRGKLDSPGRQARERNFQFTSRITGPWWERILSRDKRSHWLSCFEVEEDRVHNSISIVNGRGYTAQGRLGSNWVSEKLVPRIFPAERKVNYHWEGYYVDEPGVPYHGWGEIMYLGAASGTKPFQNAQGKFWDVSEERSGKAAARSVELRRMTPLDYRTMRKGTAEERRNLVLRTLQDWR